MQIAIHLIDGRQHAFEIADGESAALFLGRVRLWELFDRPILRVHDGTATWAFNPKFIEAIGLTTEEDPGWRPPENVIACRCIDRDAYEQKLATLSERFRRSANYFEEGRLASCVIEVILASGNIEYFDCSVMMRQRREQMMNLYQAFQKMSYAIRCEGGGYILMNPRRIVRIRIQPAPAEEDGTAWLVQCPAEQATR